MMTVKVSLLLVTLAGLCVAAPEYLKPPEAQPATDVEATEDAARQEAARQDAARQDEARQEGGNRNCMCKGPACVCCAHFNISLVDVGGPGCVHMKYLSPEEGFSVKVLYGKNLIHTSKIQGSSSPPICLDVFGSFAQVCAKFTELAPTADGLRGCLEIQPRLFGDTQLEFPIGCFRSNAGTMEMDETPPEPETSTEPEEEAEESTDEEDSGSVSLESFLLGLYQSAEKGFSLLSGLGLLEPAVNGTAAPTPAVATAPPTPRPAPQRSAKHLRHPNQL